MEEWLQRLERKLGRFTIPNLTLILVIAQALAFLLITTRQDFVTRFILVPWAVQQGEWWRLLTFLAMPPSLSPIWLLFSLGFLYSIGSALESQWGRFRYQLYWLLGYVLTIVGSMVMKTPATNVFLQMSLFLAFATMWPDHEFSILMVLPVKAKWLAAFDVFLMISMIFTAKQNEMFAVTITMLVAALASYFVFFAPTLWKSLRGASAAKANEKSTAAKAFQERSEDPRARVRQCELCGVTSDDPAQEFRVCTCEKCGRPTEFCLNHARNH